MMKSAFTIAAVSVCAQAEQLPQAIPSTAAVLNLSDGGPTPKYAAEVIGVYFAELSYLNRLSGIDSCVLDGKATVSAVMNVFDDIKLGKEIKAIEDGIVAAMTVKSALHECVSEAPQDIMALASWLMRTSSSKQALVDAASANTHLHSQEIMKQTQGVWDVFFAFNDPVGTGKALARTSYWALGPVNANATI